MTRWARLRAWWANRRPATDPEAARIRAALRAEGYRMFPVDDDEWDKFAHRHGMHRLRWPDSIDLLVDRALGDDGDGLTRDWRWP